MRGRTKLLDNAPASAAKLSRGIIYPMMRMRLGSAAAYALPLGVATIVSAGLLETESLAYGETTHQYLLWNLFLSWLPLVLALWLRRILRDNLWSSWLALFVTTAWLLLLPNSFYMVSDFIHLNDLSESQILFTAIMFTAFVFTSLCLGIASLYLIHTELLKRVSKRTAAALIGSLLLVVSLAIYVGRDLRWNSWDIIVSPFGLLFDISERLLHPDQYPQVLAVVLPFFVLLATIYYVVWQAVQMLSKLPE